MQVFLKEGFDYIPKWNDNQKKKKDDQIVIHFEFLSGSDFSYIIGEDGKSDSLKEWLSICKKVDNLTINDKKVSPEDIYKMNGLVDLYIELKLAYRSETVITKKK